MPFYVSWSGKVVQPFNQWWRCLLILGDTRKMVLLISIWYSFKYIIVLIVWNPFNDDDIDDSSGNLLFAENWRLQRFWGGFDEKSIQAGTLVFASKSFEAAKSFRLQIFPWNIPISDMIIFYMCLFFKMFSPSSWKCFPFSWTCEKPVWWRYQAENNVFLFFLSRTCEKPLWKRYSVENRSQQTLLSFFHVNPQGTGLSTEATTFFVSNAENFVQNNFSQIN